MLKRIDNQKVMKKFMLVMGLAAISAIGFGQNTSFTIGSGFTGGTFFKLNGTIQISDSTVTITTDRVYNYNITPQGVVNQQTIIANYTDIYITDGIQIGKLTVMKHDEFSPKKIKGFTPTYDVIHNINVNNPLHSVIYYVK